jgi:2-oxo-4-hydroxy-4-carboxy-5-ureidoimidazoline decarboxylase
MNATKVRLEDLNSAPAAGFAAALSNVFEHSPWIAEAATSGRPFASLAGLRGALLGVIASAPRQSRQRGQMGVLLWR